MLVLVAVCVVLEVSVLDVELVGEVVGVVVGDVVPVIVGVVTSHTRSEEVVPASVSRAPMLVQSVQASQKLLFTCR